MRLFISGVLLLSAQAANAASNCDINAIIQHAWPDARTTSQGTITQDNRVITTHSDSPKSAICRIWPAHPELTLAAVPLMTQQYSDYDNVGDLELLVLDSTTLDVKHRLRLPERMSDDAIRITGLTLDAGSQNGYVDIRVTEKSVASASYVDANEQCAAKDKPGKANWLLRYDGHQYTIPDELAPLS